jgi:lysophospholipase L1-like esterase
VSRIRVNLQDASGLTGFYFRVWRKIGSTYDLVGSSENLAPAMIAGPNTLDLTRPIAVLEGDYYGYRVESGTAANFYARTRRDQVRTHYVTDASAGGTDVDWGSQPSVKGSVLPIEIYLQAPLLVAIGDSIIAGFPVHTTFLETFAGMTRPGNDIVTYLGEQWRVTRQNMGISGQLTQEIASRFTADLVNLKPRLALLEGGANDILRGVGTQSSFLANWKRMLDACQANGIKPLVLLITPGKAYNAAQSQKRESWNAALRSLAAGYPGAVVVDASAYVGANRASGPADNAWDIAPGYSPDGLHFTPKGYQRIAQAIVDQYSEP